MGVAAAIDITVEQRRLLLELFQRHLPGTAAWAYGSRVKWTSSPKSDLDLVVFAGSAQSRQVGDLREALEESDLPFRVDLFVWDEVPESFHDEIERNHAVLTEKSKHPDSEWQTMPFSQAVQVNPKVKLVRGKEYPFVDMASVNESYRNVTATGMREFKGGGSRFQDGDTLMARITPCLENGKIARYCASPENISAHGSTEFIVVRGRPGVTDDRFAYYLTRSEKFRDFAIGQMTGTSGRQRVPTESLNDFIMALPTMPEQRAIARILGTLDDKIELNRRMCRTLEEMARALFKSWFVDFEPVRAKMAGKDPGLPRHLADLFPDRLIDSELGKIPQGWETTTIGDEVVVTGGSTPSTKDRNSWNGGINWATPKDISHLSSPVLHSTERSVTTKGLNKIPSGLLAPGTVLMSSRAPIGYFAITQISTAINQGFIAMKCEKRLSNVFVWLWAKMHLDTILRYSNGSTFQEINKREFRTLKLCIPSVILLKEFDNFVQPLFDQISKRSQECITLGRLRDDLIPKLMNGSTRMNLDGFKFLILDRQ